MSDEWHRAENQYGLMPNCLWVCIRRSRRYKSRSVMTAIFWMAWLSFDTPATKTVLPAQPMLVKAIYVFISCKFVWDEYLGIHVPLSNKKKCYALRLRLHCYHKYCGYQRWSRRFQEMLGHQWASRIVEQLSFFERSRRWLTSGCRL